MIYHFTLQAMGTIAGAALILAGLLGLFRLSNMQAFFRQMPRSRVAGIILLTIDAAWSFWLLATMEMGEFASFRKPLLVLLPIGYFLVLRFVDEFLAVRALGILFLLAAEPLLDAAFFRQEGSRLVLTAFSYVLVIAGIMWVTMPYLLRDQIDWLARKSLRWRFVSGLALAYGALLLILSFVLY